MTHREAHWSKGGGEKYAKIWRFALRLQTFTPSDTEEYRQAFTAVPYASDNYSNLQALSAYELTSVEALVNYFHAATGFPVKSTWLDDIKDGNFASWPGLTYQNAAKYFHSSHETIKGHMTQTRHNVRSTNPNPSQATQPSTKSNCLWKVFNKPPAKLQARPVSPPDLPAEVTNEVHSWEIPISNLYSDDTGRFPVRACSRNQYVIIFFIVTGTQSCRLCLKPRPTSIA